MSDENIGSESSVDTGVQDTGTDEGFVEDTGAEDQPDLTAAQLRKIKYVIDQQEYEEELSDEDLIKGYQMGKGAQKKFNEAAQMRKQSEKFIQMLKDSPQDVFAELGMDPRGWAEQYLVDQLTEQMMDPKDKELRDTKKQLEAIENERKKVEEAKQSEVYDQLVTHYQEDFQKQIIDTLNSSNLPRTEHTVSRMAYYMSKALDAGLADVTFADIAPLVKNDYEKEVQSLFGTTDIEKLINLVGEDSIKKIRSYDIDKAKKAAQPQLGQSTPKTRAEKEQSTAKLTPDEFRQRTQERIAALAAKGR